MPYKTGSRERLYGWKPKPQGNGPRMENRKPKTDLYSTSRWKRESLAWKQGHPLCEDCKSRGMTRPAEVTDHVIPFPVCGDFWDRSNWQSLCKSCNIAKGNRDRRIIEEWRQRNKTP
jgi:5-methylcytosine-specific restriction protein A